MYKLLYYYLLRLLLVLRMTTGQLWDDFYSSSNQDQAISHLSRFTTTTIKKEKYPFNWTLLHYAARRGWTRACQVLVQKYGVDPECRDYFGRTPLYLACFYNHTDTVKLLVSNGYSDPLIKSNSGETPFDKSKGVTREYLSEIIG